MTSVHLAHPPGLTPLPPWSTRMTPPCTHSLLTQSWLWKGRSHAISSLSSCGHPRTVLSGPHLLPATSRLPVCQWSSPGHTGISDMQHLQLMEEGSRRLGNDQKATKCLYSQTTCPDLPFMLAPAVGRVRHDVASTCTAHRISHHSAPLKRAGNNAALTSRP